MLILKYGYVDEKWKYYYHSCVLWIQTSVVLVYPGLY